jgi:tetratricopeptide (TPR) repeat protein
MPLLNKAYRLSPRSNVVNWSLADLYLSINKGEVARAYYERVVATTQEPERLALAKRNLAECCIASNDLDAARALLEDLISNPHESSLSLTLLASIEKGGPDGTVGQRLTAELARHDLQDEARSRYLLSLGRLHENIKAYDRAFELWTQSRALRGVTTNSSEKQKQFNEAQTSFFTPGLFAAARPHGHSSGLPVLIAGMPRSGTTLTEQVIAAHPKAYGLGELNRFPKLAQAFLKDYLAPRTRQDMLDNAAKGELKARAEETITLLRNLAPSDRQAVVEKTPFNFVALGYFALCFPNSKFIHCRRHPADNFISAFQNLMNRQHDYAYDQVAYVDRYLHQDRLMQHWKRCFPQQIFDLPYEALTADPEGTTRALLEFLGLEWDPACLRFFEKGKTVRTFSTQQVRAAIHTGSVERWRRYEKHLGPLFQALSDANFTYDPARAAG